MAEYEIRVLPTHSEVTLSGRIDLVTMAAILETLSQSADFPVRNSLWIIDEEADPPAFDDFEAITEVARRYVAMASVDKRVGIVTGAGTMSSIVRLWRASATDLQLKLEVFQDYENALLWLN